MPSLHESFTGVDLQFESFDDLPGAARAVVQDKLAFVLGMPSGNAHAELRKLSINAQRKLVQAIAEDTLNANELRSIYKDLASVAPAIQALEQVDPIADEAESKPAKSTKKRKTDEDDAA